MAVIEMIWVIHGDRADGTPWPPPGASIDVPDHEAVDLVSSGWAKYPEPEAEADEEDYDWDSLDRYNEPDEDEDDDFGYEVVTGDDDNEVEAEPVVKAVKKPKTVESKAKWLAYARYRGYTGDDAEITKNRLIAQYGD